MFCFQCEQTAEGKHCTQYGVCGKNPEVAALQDLLIHALMGLSKVAIEARKLDMTDKEVDIFTCEALFFTLTNVNFDPNRFQKLIKKTVELRDSLRKKVENAGGPVKWPMASRFVPKDTLEGLVKQGRLEGYKPKSGLDEDIGSLQNILLYVIKGVAAYTDHAYILGQKDDTIFSFIHESLATLLGKSLSKGELLGLVLKCGKINFRAMELLDAGNTGNYGHPAPTKVPLGTMKGKAILVSGHDLRDLEEILKQTEGKGIYIYTHGEMLPAHGYPKLEKYPHFYGHYETAWQNQQREFREFPGAILITTNCLMKPFKSYKRNIFTTGLVGWPNVTHIEDKDFTAVIEKALEMPGFPEDKVKQNVTVGFARNTILSVADNVIEAVKNKNLRRILLVGGCDGAKPGRNYYTELVEKAPKDTLILTLACGKFRFFDKDLGAIGDLPRLLDVGQCNDAYSAIKVALALSDAFGGGVNKLPLLIICSWYEQKAVAILLTLLYLGIKNIRLGPSLPAFITPNILSILVKNFNIMSITSAEKNLRAILR
jgi:hydroxylamine reductase